MTSLAEIYAAVNTLTQAVNTLNSTVLNSSNSVTELTAINTSINNLTNSLKVFNLSPGSTAAPATPGTIIFQSSTAVAFLLVTTSSGAIVKVPYYSNP